LACYIHSSPTRTLDVQLTGIDAYLILVVVTGRKEEVTSSNKILVPLTESREENSFKVDLEIKKQMRKIFLFVCFLHDISYLCVLQHNLMTGKMSQI